MTPNGFVDIQINGLAQIDFTADGLTLDDVRRATRILVSRGTVAYCPTVLEAPDEVMQRNLGLIAQAAEESDVAGHILGLHLEGPFLSPLDGARGAHQVPYLKQPSIEFFDKLWDWAGGKMAIMTLAPELPGSEELIRYAVSKGVVIALGHTAMDRDAFERAVAAGARLSTHLGNGIPDMINRHENPVWWQLAADEMSADFITDGHHLPPTLIKTALRAKGLERFIVVSDAGSLATMPPGEYVERGRRLVIEPSGRLSLAGTPYLAGSSAVMIECMNYLASLKLLTEDELWQVGFHNPLKLLGRDASEVAALDAPNVTFDGAQFRVKDQV
jgi:N-acetylglucosamine-6-phosphate deacetylase